MKKFWMILCMILWVSFFLFMAYQSIDLKGAWRIYMLSAVACPVGLLKIYSIFYL